MRSWLRRIRWRKVWQTSLQATRRSLPAILCSLALTSALSAEPIYSKSRKFRIPFQFDAAELKRLGAQEVQLSVSRDSGASWHVTESVPPQTARFTFEAVEDGDYWFSVKTVTGAGAEYPAGPHQASLQVSVDTQAPQLELHFEEIEPGRVRLAWSASDPHLDIETLKLEFSEADSAAWQPVSVRPQEQGQTIWTSSRAGKMLAKGTVSDRAGNTVQMNAEVIVSDLPNKNAVPDFSRPVARDIPAIGSPGNVGGANAPASVTPQLTASSSPLPIANAAATTPLSTQLIQPEPEKTIPPPSKSKTSGGPVHLVNSAVFRIAYEIDGVGPSGVGAVDLYITEDGGKKWFSYGKDPDRTSPFQVTVPADGEYGFAFRVSNGLGLVAPPPQPGDLPEVSVIVDRLPPVAQLLKIEQGQGTDHGQIIIPWTAEDRELEERPVALYFAARPSGPWEQIGGWMPNSGRYVWMVPPSLTEKFYLRLEVRDRAGNVARVDSEEPFLVDRSRPQARITEIESIRTAR